ncbi:MAG: TonB-dependent receptor domain-containing protein, partial [Gemmatimonadales bacterium]
FRTAPRAATHLSLSGGDERTSYYISGSRASMDGIVRSQAWNRTHVLGKITQRISPTFEVTASGSYIDSHQELIPEGEQTQGALTSVIFTPTAWNPNFDPALGGYPYNPVLGPNPLAVIGLLESSDDVTRFMGSVHATLRPTPSLTLRYLVGIDDYRQEVRYLQPAFSISPSFTGSIQNPLRLSRKTNHDLTATLLSRLSDAVGTNTTVGFRYASDKVDDVRAGGSNLSPEQETVGGAVLSASQALSELRTIGAFVEERLSVADRLFVTGGVNLEASSAFGSDNRWQLFPRLGVSYVLGEADFFRNSGVGDVISSLRLRAAYGQTGGQPPGAYTRFNNYIDVAHSGKPGLVASTIAGNAQLKPERQREVEGGLDIGVLSGRADLEFTVYDKRTYDLLLPVPQPPSSGSQSRLENVGELSNRGWEAALRTVNVNRSGLRWRSTLSLSHNRNRVEKLVTAADTLTYGYLNAVIEDQPIGVFYGGTYARDTAGSIVYAPVTVPVYGSVLLPQRQRDTLPGGTSVAANRVIGDPNPDLIASLLNTFEIGSHFEVTVLLDGRFGNDVANFTRRITEFFGADKVLEREISGDTIPRTFSRNPAGRIQIYEEYIEDGSYVKLREISVRYRFDQPWVRRLGAETMDIRLSGRNLVTWTDYRGIDPEINLFGNNTVARGVDFANTPNPRPFILSVQFQF